VTVNLLDVQTGRLYELEPGRPLQVGRPDAGWEPDIACASPHVSRRHCQVLATKGGQLRIRDQSTYGTFVNRTRVQGEGLATPGDSVVLGHEYELRLLATNPSAATVLEGPASEASPTRGTTAGAGPPPTESHIPTTLADGRYRVGQLLGRGGMGVVHRAHDRERDAPCAVKFQFATDEHERLERFEREARLARTLGDYPAIVKVYDFGSLSRNLGLYLVMEFIEGRDLAALLRAGLAPVVAAKLVARTARAVAYAHERGVIHRDLKPENVLVTEPELQVRLTDFGIAKEDGSPITMTGVAMGTPNYMAPEQIEDCKRAGPLADVYGLGAILYATLTRRPPYQGKGLGTVLRKVQAGALEKPSKLAPGLDPALEAICCRALSVTPADRQPSADALARELEAWIKSQAGSAESVRLRAPE
jgi:predicted Ser/Thr protein kinase